MVTLQVGYGVLILQRKIFKLVPPHQVDENAKLYGMKTSYLHILYILASRAALIMRELPGVQSWRPCLPKRAHQARLVMTV
jgi:hypothetical protein